MYIALGAASAIIVSGINNIEVSIIASFFIVISFSANKDNKKRAKKQINFAFLLVFL
jgi:hypothetical protein